MFTYVSPGEAIRHSGLRIVLVRGMPSPWAQAAKTILEVKGLDYVAAPLDVAGGNAEIAAWSGQNGAPVVAWKDERPVNRWNDILLLAERLAPAPALIPADPYLRALTFGLSNEICGESGIGWNRRLQFWTGQRSAATEVLIGKYGYDADHAAVAGSRIAASLRMLSAQLRSQHARGVPYFVGDGLSAVDIYWAAFMNFFRPLSSAQCPMPEAARDRWLNTVDPQVESALDPLLIEHRDRIFRDHFRDPMEF